MNTCLRALSQVNRLSLTANEKIEIANELGCLAEFANVASVAAAEYTDDEHKAASLSYTSAFLTELMGALIGLIQDLPKSSNESSSTDEQIVPRIVALYSQMNEKTQALLLTIINECVDNQRPQEQVLADYGFNPDGTQLSVKGEVSK